MNAAPANLHAPGPCLDLDELYDRCLGRPELVRRVMADFGTLLDAQLADLTAAIECQDYERTRAIAHRLKGASLTAAARDLSRLADRLESTVEVATLHEVQECLLQLRAECDRVKCDIETRVLQGQANA